MYIILCSTFTCVGQTSPYYSPIKSKPLGGSRFKRSLSFGGTSSTSTPQNMKLCSTPPLGRQSTVVARPCEDE